MLKKTPKSDAVLAERATTFELWTLIEDRGSPAADPAAGTEKMPVDGRLLRVDVVWQPCVSRTESGSLKPIKLAGRRRDSLRARLVREERDVDNRATLLDPCRYGRHPAGRQEQDAPGGRRGADHQERHSLGQHVAPGGRPAHHGQ